MNALFLTYNPNLGSTARVFQSWLLLGRGMGIDSIVCVSQRGPLTEWLGGHGVRFVVDPMAWPDRRRPIASVASACRLATIIRRLGPVDVIHCNEHDVYPFGVLLARVMRRPRVCYMQYLVGQEYCRWAFGGRRRPDALLWTSRQQKADCTTAIDGIIAPDRQHVVPMGLDLGRFGARHAERDQVRREWGIDRDAVAIGTASALRPRKRIEDFVELVRRMAAESPRVVGVLAGDARPGDEAYRERVLRQVEDAGLGPRFRWVGKLTDVERFYHAIDVFVSTSEYETFGMSVLEAMACRRPVAAYRGGSVAEVVADSGLVVETGDLDALTAAVRELVGASERREAVALRGRQRVAETYNPAASLRRLGEIYRTVATRRRP